MITEKSYIQEVDISHRKKFGQFFTPDRIADFMAGWVVKGMDKTKSILEPAFGLGAFYRAISKMRPDVNVTGYDVDEKIFRYASEIFLHSQNVTLRNQNYLTASWEDKYDGIICNPPYLKFHDYDNSGLVPLVNDKLHTRLNGFTNLYTLFLLKSISQLKDGGRLAYIIPSEFLNSDYGVEVKRALLESGVLRHIVIVDFTKCAFDDALTTACILLCQKDGRDKDINFSIVNNVTYLEDYAAGSMAFKPTDLNPEVKWRQYYDSTRASNYHDLVPFSTFAKVTRGIATGANDYFTFRQSKITSLNLPQKCFRPCICHAADVKSLIFTPDDLCRLVKEEKTVYLFDAREDETNKNVQAYLKYGVGEDIDKKYLTASRSPWYALENRPPAPIWVSVFNRKGLRFVRNKAAAYNLTTFHCVYNTSEVDTDLLFAYLLTDMAKEIFMDNSRQYGNGLVKFEPNDLNKGKVVDLRILSDDEKKFILKVSECLNEQESLHKPYITLLDEFFRDRYSNGNINLTYYMAKLRRMTTEEGLRGSKRPKVPPGNLPTLFGESRP